MRRRAPATPYPAGLLGRRGRRPLRQWLGAAVAVLTVIAVGAGPRASVPPTAASSLTTLFNSYGDSSGAWAAGDAAASVLLPDGRTAWLFSDTMYGRANADHKLPFTDRLVHNSLIVQDTAGNLVSTLVGGTRQAPTALVPASASDASYFVGDGTVSGSQLQVLYNLYQRPGPTALDVTLQGTALATFALPGLGLTGVTDLNLGSRIAWGSRLLNDGGYTYIFGSELGYGQAPNFMHLARVATGGLAGAWQYWTGTGWTSHSTASVRLLSGVGTAFGVQKVGQQYLVVTMDSHLPFNADIVAYTAPAVTGPYTGPINLMTVPDPAAAATKHIPLIAYDARLHPEQATDGTLLVSYNVDALNIANVYADVRNYRPRFVDIAWPVARPDPGLVPAAPTGLAAATDLDGTVSLTWHGQSGVTYNVYQRDITAGATVFVRSAKARTTPAGRVAFARDGHRYQIKVTAVNAAGEGPASPAVTATATVAPTAAPTGVRATVDLTGKATVSWAPVAGARTYEVDGRDHTAGETAFIRVQSVGPDQTHIDVPHLVDGHQYDFQVVANNRAGASPASATVSITVHLSPPPAPAGLTATTNGDGSIGLAWTAPGPDLWYWVYQRDATAGESDFTRLPLPISSGTTMTAAYLVDGHRYEYEVSATNSVGESPVSAVASATSTYPVPAAPTNLTATNSNGQAVLSWTASRTPNVWYLVYLRDRTTEESFTQSPLPITTCCTVTMGALANGHTYDFEVVATAAGKNSTVSNMATIVPEGCRLGDRGATCVSAGPARSAYIPPA